MLKLTLLVALLACSAVLQGCGITFGCSEADKASCTDVYCNPSRTGCMVTPPPPSVEPGVVIAPPSCTEQGAKVVVPPPFFTARTRLDGMPIASPNVKQCEPFEVIWNVCNAGSVTSASTVYTVRLKEEFPAGANGFDHTETVTAPAIGKCSCIQTTFSSQGLHCNEPAFIPTRTLVTTSLPGTTVEPPQGAFNVVL